MLWSCSMHMCFITVMSLMATRPLFNKSLTDWLIQSVFSKLWLETIPFQVTKYTSNPWTPNPEDSFLQNIFLKTQNSALDRTSLMSHKHITILRRASVVAQCSLWRASPFENNPLPLVTCCTYSICEDGERWRLEKGDPYDLGTGHPVLLITKRILPKFSICQQT